MDSLEKALIDLELSQSITLTPVNIKGETPYIYLSGVNNIEFQEEYGAGFVNDCDDGHTHNSSKNTTFDKIQEYLKNRPKPTLFQQCCWLCSDYEI